ncbi:cyclophilin-like protein [Mytilinidion resinicola]|uniref:Cyclophilin-like protein n=1 Tax=Mytilinidion resinicola TaxID=574789 RepID=A0A6A6YSE4_9PEZI|nr:cyclophilin-like protein [Mytilinidion resinicola]KAF2811293.1 cyclophilin-like protein [Mytilinidion resinicola]
MSSVYNLEPQPTAKVLLQTTSGDIEIELFAKQTPITSRNFIQLCLDGYYDGTIFHRLVPGFIIQGGDPTGTGSGGESSYDGEPFVDEYHSRLKYNRRGLLGMANSGKKDDNGSQFFLTLGNTPELTGKNTFFGRVAGDTIYNLMKMGEADLAEEGGDRPLYPTKITGTEILVNPFEGMEKRIKTAKSAVEEVKPKKKPKRKAGKALLSFGGDEGEDDAPAPIVKKAKFNPNLVDTGEVNQPAKRTAPTPAAVEPTKEIPIRRPTPASPSPAPPSAPARASKPNSPPRKVKPRSPSRSPSPESRQAALLARTNAQIAELKASMKRTTATSAAAAPKKKSALEALIPETSVRARKRRPGATNAETDKDTLALLDAFKAKLESAPAVEKHPLHIPAAENGASNGDHAPLNGKSVPAPEDDDEKTCDLHFIVGCQSCTAWDAQQEEESEDDDGWMSHALSFAKDRLGKDLEWKRKNEEELVVIDPREKAKEIKKGRKGKEKR